MFGLKITPLIFLSCLLTVLTIPLNVGAEKTSVILANDQDLALGRDVNRQRDFRPEPGRGSADLFGTMGGYIHPYLSVTGLYSDNIYNAPTNEESDFLTIFSPGIMLAYPGIKNMPGASFSTSDLTPGGLVASRGKAVSFRRFQTSLLYQADLESYADNSSAARDHRRAEGLLQFNLKGGVSLDLAGEHKLATAAISQNAPLDEYQSDFIDLLIDIEIGSKMDLALGYANFNIAYDTIVNSNDRQDNTYTGRLSYNILARTAIFAEYQVIVVDFDQQVFPDNKLRKIIGGVNWTASAKSSGNFKVGLSSREHEDSDVADNSVMSYQFQAGHKFTPKSSLTLAGARRMNETTVAGTNYIINNQGSLAYRQTLSPKFAVILKGSYSRDKYDRPVTLLGETKSQRDNTLLISPSLDYLMRDWFTVTLAYSLSQRDSNFDYLDYTTNSFYFRVTGYL
jgi:hypothetical protein